MFGYLVVTLFACQYLSASILSLSIQIYALSDVQIYHRDLQNSKGAHPNYQPQKTNFPFLWLISWCSFLYFVIVLKIQQRYLSHWVVTNIFISSPLFGQNYTVSRIVSKKFFIGPNGKQDYYSEKQFYRMDMTILISGENRYSYTSFSQFW